MAVLAALGVLFSAGCGGSEDSDEEGTRTPATASPAMTASPAGATAPPAEGTSVLGPIPEDARVSDGGGEPRTAGYWEMWSSCGENSQAEVAAANGGREAGWVLLDDLIADPGLALGSFEVTSCDSAVDLLRDGSAPEADAVLRLGSVLLLAEANLSTGAESCRAIEGVVRVSHALLADTGFEGPGTQGEFTEREGTLAAELSAVLASYSSGELCR